MPIVKDGRSKKDMFRCQTREELGIIEIAQKKFCDSNHDNYDFLSSFLGAHSIKPGAYIINVKNGRIMISVESWNKIKDYVTTLESK